MGRRVTRCVHGSRFRIFPSHSGSETIELMEEQIKSAYQACQIKKLHDGGPY